MDKKSFQSRLYVVAGIMGGFFLLFLAVLWNLQMVNGSNFLEQATRRILQVETVDAVRGEILDRNGRVLVSNRSTYQVTLETSFEDDLGADSVDLVEQVMAIEEEFEVGEIQEEDLSGLKTVGDTVNYIASKLFIFA